MEIKDIASNNNLRLLIVFGYMYKAYTKDSDIDRDICRKLLTA